MDDIKEERMTPYELIEHTIFSMDRSTKTQDSKVQTIAYALYLLTGNYDILEKFDLTDDNYSQFREMPKEVPEREPQRENQLRQGNIILGNNPSNRTNSWTDDGLMHSEDRAIDRAIERPAYRRDPSKGTAQFYRDINCSKCGILDYVDTRTFKGDYMCDKCTIKHWK